MVGIAAVVVVLVALNVTGIVLLKVVIVVRSAWMATLETFILCGNVGLSLNRSRSGCRGTGCDCADDVNINCGCVR